VCRWLAVRWLRARLCPSCVLEVEVHPTSYVKCAVCQEAAVVLTRPGTDVSFAGALRGTLRLPVGLSGLLLVYALAAAASELDGLAPPLRAVALLGWSAVAWLLGVAIVQATAEDATTLRTIRLQWPDIVRPASVATVLTAPARQGKGRR
jgi:hypothetical protein